MPIPLNRSRSPFVSRSEPAQPELLRPQARLLKTLAPPPEYDDPEWQFEWATVTRAQLSVCAGFTAISGTTTRALNGVPDNGSVNKPHLGLLGLGYVEEVILDICGRKEVNYRITATGIRAWRAYVAENGDNLPPVKSIYECLNNRYKKSKEQTEP